MGQTIALVVEARISGPVAGSSLEGLRRNFEPVARHGARLRGLQESSIDV